MWADLSTFTSPVRVGERWADAATGGFGPSAMAQRSAMTPPAKAQKVGGVLTHRMRASVSPTLR